jgi:hypothetical protein
LIRHRLLDRPLVCARADAGRCGPMPSTIWTLFGGDLLGARNQVKESAGLGISL